MSLLQSTQGYFSQKLQMTQIIKFLLPVFIYIIANPVSLHVLPYYVPKTHIVPVKGLFRTKC